jgi:hypothetical protein
VSRASISGLDWIHKVRDSKDLIVKANAVKYRRDKFGESVKYVAPQTVKAVALAIGSFMDQTGVARVGVPTLCDRFRFSPLTVRCAVRVIAAAGWLAVEPGGGAGNTNVYRACIPASAEFLKSGCRDTASEAETGFSGSESGRPVTTKKVEEELRLRGREGSNTQLVGEGALA